MSAPGLNNSSAPQIVPESSPHCYSNKNSSTSPRGLDQISTSKVGSAQLPDTALQSEPRMFNNSIRPLRSLSSSEKCAPALDDIQPRAQRGLRRFSMAGPAGSGGGNGGPSQSHTLLSLHTWAEEEDEMAVETSPRMYEHPSLVSISGTMSCGFSTASHGRQLLASQMQHRGQLQPQPQQQPHPTTAHPGHMRNLSSGNHQPQRIANHGSISSGSINSVAAANGGGAVINRFIPETTFGFQDMGSSSSSSGPLSAQQTAGNGRGNGRRLRTPYSISIPSMIGSPLSFTQPFLASRTSIYGGQPPSSQIRAAHIDWDSLSMVEEVHALGGGNRGDLPVWQHGLLLSIDMPNGANSSGNDITPKGIRGQPHSAFPRPVNSAHSMPFQQQQRFYQQQQQQHIYQQLQLQQQYMWQQQQQNQQHHNQLQQNQRQHRLHNQLQPGQFHKPAQSQSQTRTMGFSEFFPHPSCMQGAPISSYIGNSGPSAVAFGNICASAAHRTFLEKWEKQMAWDYACYHHPLLTSFSIASPLKLSVAWRWVLLCVIAFATAYVLVGTLLALMLLLAH